jgi:hypothetical protein
MAKDNGYDGILDKYETVCDKCIELRRSAASGVKVLRDEVQKAIGEFLTLNKLLKSFEDQMTVIQRRRFSSISKWFTVGGELERDMGPLPAVSNLSMDVVLPMPLDTTKLRVTRPSVIHEDLIRGRYCLLLSMAVPDEAFGLMTAYQHGRWGGYLSFRSNYVFGETAYECTSEGNLPSGGSFWGTGEYRKTNLIACVGGLGQVHKVISIYAGVGYGIRKMAWEDVDGAWAVVSDLSHSGFAAESGLIFSYNKLVASAGISTVKFRAASFTCGIGIKF